MVKKKGEKMTLKDKVKKKSSKKKQKSTKKIKKLKTCDDIIEKVDKDMEDINESNKIIPIILNKTEPKIVKKRKPIKSELKKKEKRKRNDDDDDDDKKEEGHVIKKRKIDSNVIDAKKLEVIKEYSKTNKQINNACVEDLINFQKANIENSDKINPSKIVSINTSKENLLEEFKRVCQNSENGPKVNIYSRDEMKIMLNENMETNLKSLDKFYSSLRIIF